MRIFHKVQLAFLLLETLDGRSVQPFRVLLKPRMTGENCRDVGGIALPKTQKDICVFSMRAERERDQKEGKQQHELFLVS